MLRRLGLILGYLIAGATVGRAEETTKATICQIKEDPDAYNRRLLEVSGFVSNGFEDFTFIDPICPTGLLIWLDNGKYALPYTTVDGTPISRMKDKLFRDFDKLIRIKPSQAIQATFVGRFYARSKVLAAGFGHLGCCSLLAIQQVLSIGPRDRKDLDYQGRYSPPLTAKSTKGCGSWRSLPLDSNDLDQQRKAEGGEVEWAFNDPQRVAMAVLERSANIEVTTTKDIKHTIVSPGAGLWMEAHRTKVHLLGRR